MNLRPRSVTPERAALDISGVVATTLGLFVRRGLRTALFGLPGTVLSVAVFWLLAELFERVPVSYAESNVTWLLCAYVFVVIGLGFSIGTVGAPLVVMVSGLLDEEPCAFRAHFRPIWSRPLLLYRVSCAIVAAMLTPAFVLMPMPLLNLSPVALFLALATALYALARWGSALSVAAVEVHQSECLGRSAWLTRGYRLALCGTYTMLIVIATLISAVVGAGLAILSQIVGAFLVASEVPGPLVDLLIALDVGLSVFVGLAIMIIGSAVLHARLVEIKEPPDLARVVDVFE